MERSDICLSLGYLNFEETLFYVKKAKLAEIRIDLLNITEEELKKVFAFNDNLIATFRTNDNQKKMITLLNLAMESGSAYVDIDIETPENVLNTIIKQASSMNNKIILSYHNYDTTPDERTLEQYIDKMFDYGADIAKLACKANTSKDCSTIMGLYSKYSNIVAFSMGDMGVITRFAAPILGAPFTYASPESKKTAPGQVNYKEIETFLNQYFIDKND